MGEGRHETKRLEFADWIGLSGVSHHAEARRVLESILRDGATSEERLKALIWCLQDGSPTRSSERTVVCRYLRRIPLNAYQRKRAARALATVITTQPERSGAGDPLAVPLLAVGALLATFILIMGDGPRGLAPNVLQLAAAGGILIGLPALGAVVGADQRRRESVEALLSLGTLAGTSALPCVAAAAAHRRPEVRSAAHRAIVPILAQTSDDDYGRLGSVVIDVCRLLQERNDTLVVAALEGLARFGDGRAVEPVERLLQGTEVTPEVRAAAEKALPILCIRREQEGSSARLLRPASNPDEHATLLRAAANVGRADEELLLRAVEGEPD